MARYYRRMSGSSSRLNFVKEAKENKPPMLEILSNNFYLIRLSWQASKVYFIFKVIDSAVSGLMPVATSYTLKLLLDAITAHRSMTDFRNALLISLGLNLVNPIFRFISTLTREKANINMTVLVNKKLFDRISKTEVKCYDIPGWYDNLNNAIHSNSDGFGIVDSTAGLLSNVTSIIVMSMVVIRFNVYIFWAIVLLSVITIVIQQLLRKVRFNYMITTAPERRKTSYYNDLFFSGRYSKERKMFGITDWLVERYDAVYKELKSKLTKVNLKSGSGNIATSIMSVLLTLSVIFIAGSRAISGELTIGLYTYYTTLANKLNNNIQSIVNDLISFYEKGLYARNMIEFLENDDMMESITDQGVKLTEGIPHSIEFKNVTFSYPGQTTPVLNNLSMVLHAGTKTCIAGDNGAGKSTIVKLMMRLYRPDSGEILIDGINIDKYDIEELRKVYGVVFQDFNQYAFTVAENILMRNFIEDDRPVVAEALGKGGILEKIEASPNNIKSNLTRLFDDEGLELSGGEWQKLSISRTYARNAGILILDEPSSSLDARSEHDLFVRFREISEGKTTVFISHRLSSAKIADYIYYIKKGAVIEEGNHQQLMALNGDYAYSFKLQMERYLDDNMHTMDDIIQIRNELKVGGDLRGRMRFQQNLAERNISGSNIGGSNMSGGNISGRNMSDGNMRE